MTASRSELQVITFAKNLLSYVMTVTQRSPKQYEQISLQACRVQNLPGAWIISDQKRMSAAKRKNVLQGSPPAQGDHPGTVL